MQYTLDSHLALHCALLVLSFKIEFKYFFGLIPERQNPPPIFWKPVAGAENIKQLVRKISRLKSVEKMDVFFCEFISFVHRVIFLEIWCKLITLNVIFWDYFEKTQWVLIIFWHLKRLEKAEKIYFQIQLTVCLFTVRDKTYSHLAGYCICYNFM